MFGYKNPANAANPYLDQVKNLNQYQDPWFNTGKDALGQTYSQYTDITNNPGGKINQIGESYSESPGLKSAIQKALEAAGGAAAAGGMAGSPEHEEQNMQTATDLANQDYYKWLEHAQNMYNTGLGGLQGESQQGQQAGQNMTDRISAAMAQQANMAYQNQQQKNQNKFDLWHTALKGAGQIAGSFSNASTNF